MIFLILAVLNIVFAIAGVVMLLVGGSYSTLIIVFNFIVGYVLYRIWMMQKIQEEIVDTINKLNPGSGDQ